MSKGIVVDTNEVIGKLNPKIWGMFYEEINHAGDGGLYAELIRNRNFSESNSYESTLGADGIMSANSVSYDDFDTLNSLYGWHLAKTTHKVAYMEKYGESPRNSYCPDQLKLSVTDDSESTRLINSGHYGVLADKIGYSGFIIMRSHAIKSIRLGLMHKNGMEICSTAIFNISEHFKKYEFAFASNKKDVDARFFIEINQCGELYIDFVSLFPNNRHKMFRKDIFDMLKELHPGFLRFPGGCVVEGVNLENAVNWKKTIGKIEDRPGHWDLWGCRATDGLGMTEFCMLAEELEADIMYIINCGMSCQAKNSIIGTDDEIKYWLEEALDAIEYMLGSSDTKWGKIRAESGHPMPFKLKYVEIGNENWGDDYHSRYQKFYNVLKGKYPNLRIIADSVIPHAKFDLIDDHYYVRPQDFPAMFDCYKTKKTKYKVYVGEYSCNQDVGYGNLLSAIAEATFMIGMERSPNTVEIATYAPLLCHEMDRKWPVNLINFDNNSAFGIPLYYVQKAFIEFQPETIVAAESDIKELYVSAGLTDTNLIVKVATYGEFPIRTTVKFNTPVEALGQVAFIQSESTTDTNSISNPCNVVSMEKSIIVVGNIIDYTFQPYSLNIFKLKLKL